MSGMVIKIGGDASGAKRAIDDISLSLKEQKQVLAALQRQYASLNTAQAKGKIGKEIAADIRIAKEEIARLGAVSSNSFGEVGKGASKAFSAVRQFAYILPGIGIAGIIGGLSDMVIGLFNSANAFDAADIAAGKFDNTIRNMKDSLDQLKTSLDFQNRAQKLINELNGLSGSRLSLANAGADISQNTQLITSYTEQITRLTAANKKLVDQRIDVEKAISATTGTSSPLATAIFKAGGIDNISEAMTSKFSKADQEILRQYRKTNEEIKSLSKQRQEAFLSVNLGLIESALVTQKGDKATPSAGGAQVAGLPDGGKLLDLFLRRIKEQTKKPVLVEIPVDFKIKEPEPGSFSAKNIGSELQNQLKGLASLVSDTLTPVFDSFFSTIAQGGNAFKAFAQAAAQALTGLITKLLTTAALSLILGPVLGIGVGVGAASSKFADVFKFLSGFGGRAAGGPVAAGRPVVVGEAGRELFIPSTSGRIVPNGSLSQFAGQAAQMINVTVNGVISGNNLALVMARQNRYQLSNV